MMPRLKEKLSKYQKAMYGILYDMLISYDMCKKYEKRLNYLPDKKPNNFEEMKEYASKLCKDFKCVRVDFYSINNETYLSELTFIPASGRITYKNPNTNLEFGKLLRL